jgi:hypothetical protein
MLRTVERRSRPADRRVKLVGLTRKGALTKREVTKDLYEPPGELLELDVRDLQALERAVAKLGASPASRRATTSSK